MRASTLAIYLSSRGFGYALFEGQTTLIDWGAKTFNREKNRLCLLKISVLVQLYRPGVVVLEDCEAPRSRRRKRIRVLADNIATLMREKRTRTHRYSRHTIQANFKTIEKTSKEAIAREIVRRFPELEPYLPPKRKPWTSEDYRMAIFDAVSLALTHFAKS